MQQQFLDRLLNCVDCHAEFIFTAGEQIFFFDKQFKNDPKRCKPCKSRRSGLAAAANGAAPPAAGLSRTETRTQCSECGIDTTVPFKPTQGRPVLCRECFQRKNRAAQPLAAQHVQAAGALALTALSTNPAGASLSPNAALLAAASMSTASAHSSVASPADLASISGFDPLTPSPQRNPADTTGQLIAQAPSDLVSSEITAELLAAAAESPQA